MQRPNIFGYDNYRSFLRDLYEGFKAQGTHFSFRYFSKQAGFGSPNMLKRVIDGERNLSSASVEKFIKALGLTKAESAFFRNLVSLNQASTVDEKVHYADIILHQSGRKLKALKKEQYSYYSKWYLVPIREMVGLSNFQEDAVWIAKQLKPAISASEAERALSILEKIGMIKRDKTGRLVQADGDVSVGDNVGSAYIAQYHRNMIQMSSDAMDRFDLKDRNISSVTVGISKKNSKKVEELIRATRQEILQLAETDREAESVYQINFQLFPLTKGKSGGIKQ